MKEPEIRCPKCGWRPKTESRWQCVPGCGTHWNTFWTGGVCPGCSFRWEHTQCLSCKQVSPHKDWYHFPDEDEADRAEGRAEKAGA